MSYLRRKTRVGRVIGDKMDKTCIVEVEWRSFHRVYKKSIRRRSRFKAHDENNTAQIGDLVTIVESRPMSKTKRWRLVDVVERPEMAELPPEDDMPTGEIEITIPEPVVEEAVSQEEEPQAPMETSDESQDEPEEDVAEEPTVAEEEGSDSSEESEPEDAVEETAESAAEEEAPAEDTSESEDAVEEATENAVEEEAPAEAASESEDTVEEAPESADEEEAPAEESSEAEDVMEEAAEGADEEEAPTAEEDSTSDEKADKEKPQQ